MSSPYRAPRMVHAEAEFWSLSVATWVAALVWLVVRAATRSTGYRA